VAFDTMFSRIITNAPLPAAMYDFTITGPREAEGEIPVLLQTALKITFDLTGRKETRLASVLLLRMKTPTAIGRSISPTESKAFRYGGGEISGIGVTMQQLASALEDCLKQPVLDETDSNDEYDITLKWNETKPDTINREALLTAVRDQLGLELIPATRPVEMVIIEQNKADPWPIRTP